MVSLDIEHTDLEKRIELWGKLISLKSIQKDEYNPDILFADSFILDNQKEISRVYIEQHQVSIHNKNTWQETMLFLNNTMKKFEAFFMTYRDNIGS